MSRDYNRECGVSYYDCTYTLVIVHPYQSTHDTVAKI